MFVPDIRVDKFKSFNQTLFQKPFKQQKRTHFSMCALSERRFLSDTHETRAHKAAAHTACEY